MVWTSPLLCSLFEQEKIFNPLDDISKHTEYWWGVGYRQMTKRCLEKEWPPSWGRDVVLDSLFSVKVFFPSPSQSMKWGEFPLALSLSQSQARLVMNPSVVWISFNHLQIISSVTQGTPVTLDSWNVVMGEMIPLLSPAPFNMFPLQNTPTLWWHRMYGISVSYWKEEWKCWDSFSAGLGGAAQVAVEVACVMSLDKGTWWIGSSSVPEEMLNHLSCVGYLGLVFAYTQLSWTPVSSCWTTS